MRQLWIAGHGTGLEDLFQATDNSLSSRREAGNGYVRVRDQNFNPLVESPGRSESASDGSPCGQLNADQLGDLQRIAEVALALSNGSGAALAWGDSRQMICVASSGDSAPPVGTPIDPASGLARDCIRTGEVAWCVNASLDLRVSHHACEELGIRSLLYLPICIAGKISGLLGVFASEAGHFSEADVAKLKRLAALIPDVLGSHNILVLADLLDVPEAQYVRAESAAVSQPRIRVGDSTDEQSILSSPVGASGSRLRVPILTAAAVGLIIATAGWISYHGSNGVQAKSTPPVAIAQPAVVPPPPAPVEPEKTPILAEQKVVVVIDPGHGGRDVGTTSSTGLLEKDLTLDIAQRLGELLKDRLGCEIVLTRTEDKFVPLETRAAVANNAHADFLISIHGNSSSYEDVRGIETYYYRPNIEISEADADPAEAAKSFANDVQSALLTGLKDGRKMLRDRGVKSASFVVLREVQMPAALSEISFMSSSRDAEQLDTPQYRDRVAEALYKGIANHLSHRKSYSAIADLNQKRALDTQTTAVSESR